MYYGRRMIIKDDTDLEDVLGFTVSQGFRLLREVSAGEFVQGYVGDLDWEIAPDTYLRYHQDEPSFAQMMAITGEDEAESRKFSELIERTFPSYSYQELLDAVADARPGDDFGYAVIRVGLGAPNQPQADFVKVITDALEHPETAVRTAGVRAAAWTGWPIFLPLLGRIADDADDAELRALAENGALAIRRREGYQ